VLVPPAALIVLVLGSILFGLATPTEAASIGCIGALLLAGRAVAEGKGQAWPVYVAAGCMVALVPLVTNFDLRMQRNEVPVSDAVAAVVAGLCILAMGFGVAVSLKRVYRSGILSEVMQTTVKISAMVFVILLGASVFSLVFRGLGGDQIVEDVLKSMPGGAFGAMLVVMTLMFVMGFFLDFIEIVYVVVPIVAPALMTMGLDPVWIGVMIAVNLQTSFLTPPFGFALFYLRGVAPPEVTTFHIYGGVVPFIAIQIAALVILALFPGLVLWLPKLIYG
jgi:TRAP-type mannitol/chloroaromatic compound transport system permease large subunit